MKKQIMKERKKERKKTVAHDKSEENDRLKKDMKDEIRSKRVPKTLSAKTQRNYLEKNSAEIVSFK